MNRQILRKKTILLFLLSTLLIGLNKTSTAQSIKWTKKATKPLVDGSGISSAMCFTIGNKIYIGGGYVGSFTNTKQFYEYDITTNTWTKKADLPGGFKNRSEGIAFAISGKGYIGLGAEDYQAISGAKNLSDLWEYNPTSDTWTAKASLPDTARTSAGCFVLNNKAYVVGGSNQSSDLWEYNPSTNSWTEKAPYPLGKIEDAFVFALGSGASERGYVSCGGSFETGVGYLFYNKTYAYDAATNTWSPKANFPASVRREGTAFTMNGKAYCGLGVLDKSYSKFSDTFFSYNPISDTWSGPILNKIPGAGRARSYAASLANSAYLGGGWALSGSVQLFHNDFFKVDSTNPLGIIASPNNNSMVIYPNPAKDELSISIPSINTDQAEVVFYNVLGTVSMKKAWKKNEIIDIKSLSKGLYILKIQTKDAAYYDRVIIAD